MDAYKKLKRAYEQKRGLRLTPADVCQLMRDTAIYDAVMETYETEVDDEIKEMRAARVAKTTTLVR